MVVFAAFTGRGDRAPTEILIFYIISLEYFSICKLLVLCDTITTAAGIKH